MTYADPPIRPAPSWLSLRFLQRYPHLLEVAYDLTTRLLKPFQRWLKPGSLAERIFIPLEAVTKGAIFDCHMCGQCVLHSTGMTCPQTCPKNLRNGPCGGVRANGRCEILPDLPCVWVQAWERFAADAGLWPGTAADHPAAEQEPAQHLGLDQRLYGRRPETSPAWTND